MNQFDGFKGELREPSSEISKTVAAERRTARRYIEAIRVIVADVLARQLNRFQNEWNELRST